MHLYSVVGVQVGVIQFFQCVTQLVFTFRGEVRNRELFYVLLYYLNSLQGTCIL